MAAILIQRCSASKHAGHCQNYAPCAQSVHTRGRVAATYPWDMYPQHFHVCANFVILSLLHVPATRLCYMSPQCVLHKFSSLHLKHDPSCLPTFIVSWLLTCPSQVYPTNHLNESHNQRKVIILAALFCTLPILPHTGLLKLSEEYGNIPKDQPKISGD